MNKTGDISSRFAGVIYYGMRALVLLSVVIFLFRGDWGSAFSAAFISVLMFLPSILKKQYRLYFPFELDLAIVVFIFLTLFLGSLANFYEQIWWWDDLLHLLSGFLFGILGFVVIYLLNSERIAKLNLSPFFVSLFTVCFSLAVSVIWEIYEFAADQIFSLHMQRDGIVDTMTDLIANCVAALIVACVAYVWMRRQKKIPFTPTKLSRFQYKGDGKKS